MPVLILLRQLIARATTLAFLPYLPVMTVPCLPVHRAAVVALARRVRPAVRVRPRAVVHPVEATAVEAAEL